MIKIMKRLKQDISNNKDIYGFDVETHQKDMGEYIKQDFYMGSVVGKAVKRYFFDKTDMCDFLLSRKLRNSLVYATNLEFDFCHTFSDDKRRKNMFFIDRNGIIYVKYSRDDRNHTHFIDTWNYTGKISVKKMGDLLKIPKLPQPTCFKRKAKTSDERQELIDYNIRDSEITYKFGEFMRDFCTSIKAKQKITLASIGMDYWRRNHQPYDVFCERRFHIDRHYKAFKGGRVEVFKRGLFSEDNGTAPIYVYDYNSHYPSCCHDGVDGKGSYPDPNHAYYDKEINIEHIKNYEGVSCVSLTVPYMYIPVLGINLDNKFIFPVGKIHKTWFNNYELRKALDNGYKITKFYEGIYYKGLWTPFRECIKTLYKLRRDYQKDGNIIMANMIKLLMNGGIYGKFGQKIDEKSITHFVENLTCDDTGHAFIEIKGKKRPITDYMIRGDYIFEKRKVNNYRIPVFVQPILASYTASIARIKLWDDLNKNSENMIYCDTDSIVSNKKIYDTSTKLGELKLEQSVKEAVFIKPKFYYYCNEYDEYKFKTKGVGKFISNKGDFDRVMIDKRVNTKRFTKIKESAIRKLPFSSIIDVTKKLNMNDNKRSWKYNFNVKNMQDSTPITI